MDPDPRKLTTDSNPHAPIPKWLVPGIFLTLIVWGAYLAIGAAVSGDNIWRGVVVIACFALFLGWFWGLQRLYARRHGK